MKMRVNNPKAKLVGITPLIAGSIYPLSFSPLNFWPLATVTLAILWYCLHAGEHQPKNKGGFLPGFLFGLGTYGVGTSWIFVSIFYFGKVPLITSVLVTIAFTIMLAATTGLATWAYSKLTPVSKLPQSRPWLLQALTFTACWIIVEWSRTWLLSGFPWLFVGYASSENFFQGFVPVFGILGTGAIMLFSTLLIFSCLGSKTKAPLFLSLCGVLCLAAWGFSHKQWTQIEQQNPLQVHLIQGNIPQSEKRDPRYFPEHLEIYKQMTLDLFKQGIGPGQHLLIWPEAAIPIFYHEAWNTINQIDQLAKENNTAWLSGVPWAELNGGNPRFYNSIFALGIGSGFYAKQRLVPFGESLPFPKIARKFGALFNLSPVGFTPGPQNQQALTAQGVSIAPFICYEVVFPALVRQYAKEADMLLTISNDGWFGHSLGPHQHFQIARMRALETGKMLLRVTNNGITAIVDGQGKVTAQLPRFERGLLQGTVYATTGATPFMVWSHWPILAPLLILLALRSTLALSKNRKQKNRSDPIYAGKFCKTPKPAEART